MSKPVLLWKSLLRNSGAIITASSTAADFDVNAVANMRAWDIWKAGSVLTPITIDLDLGASGSDNADTLGLVNTNLATIFGTVEVRYGSVFPPTNVALVEQSVLTDNVVLLPFTNPGSFRYWRLSLGGPASYSAAPFIGELWIGAKTQFPEFPDPEVDPFMQQDEVVSQRSKGGQFLGAIIRGQRHEETLNFGGPAGIDRGFFTSDLNAFYTQHAMRRRPFFFQYDAADPDFNRAFFLKVPDTAKLPRRAVGGVTQRFKGELPVEEAFMELA